MKNLKSKTLKTFGATMLATTLLALMVVLRQNECLVIWHSNLITLMLFAR